MRAYVVAGSALLFTPAIAHAEGCAPKITGAKVLQSANQSDVRPGWVPPAKLGQAWSLLDVKREKGDGATA